MAVEDCLEWKGVEANSFLFKAQWNLNVAETARQQGLFDIEANRTYYALHQLACELVRKGKMCPDREGKHTGEAVWKLDHGSYGNAIRVATGIPDADLTISRWMTLRTKADYEPDQVCRSAHWKVIIGRIREEASVLAEVIYAILTTRSTSDHSTASTRTS